MQRSEDDPFGWDVTWTCPECRRVVLEQYDTADMNEYARRAPFGDPALPSPAPAFRELQPAACPDAAAPQRKDAA